MRINGGTPAFEACRTISVTNTALAKALNRLAPGFRTDRAADGAARLAEPEGRRAELRATGHALRGAEDGVRFVQTGESALNEVLAILQRIRELAVDAAATATTEGTAQQARITELLAHATATLAVAVENQSACASAVREADMALDMVSIARNQIMAQAGFATSA